MKSKIPKRYKAGFLAGVNRASTPGRELSEVFAAVVNDSGGVDSMSVGSLMVAERLTFLDAMLRAWERKIAEDPMDNIELVGRWTQGCNTLAGLVKMLKLDRSRDNSVIDGLYQFDEEDEDDPENTAEKPPGTPSKGVQGKGR